MTLRERMPFLAHAENRESFFRRIALFFPKSDPRYKAIVRAYNYAKDAFRGIEREDGSRYFEHLRAVALILIDYVRVKDYELIIAALLHDIVEDVPSWTVERVREDFGDRVAFLVDYVTKPSKAEYENKSERERVYHFRFRSAPRAVILLKLADRLHNLMTLASCSKEKRLRKLAETKKYYLPYAEEQFILLHQLEEILAKVVP